MSKESHILIVDDDKRIRELLKTYLGGNGYLVTTAGSAAEARQRSGGIAFDLVVLDIMMPGENGIEFAKSLRAGGNNVPILMLSALAEPDDRIAGLATGSDDYLVKPFEPRELLLRIQNILRRAVPQAPQVMDVQFGPCVFNIPRGELRRSGELVRLTSKEKELLRLLAQSSGKPVSRIELAQSGTDESARSVDVQINRLRQKIERQPSDPQWIQTVRGSGYVLLANEG
jgi:two-component system, OmpR family, phosphate regulon response regulator OmpR